MPMKTKISAEIVAHSINKQGDELISLLVTFPRIILAEVNTHRMLSKNTSSSRAIPFAKMVESVKNDSFIPIAWQKEHKGMQGTEYLNAFDSECAKEDWLTAMEYAVEVASNSNMIGVTKQLCNRLLEPFMWTTMLITGPKSGWDNFFRLRCPEYRDKSIKGGGSLYIHRSKKEFLRYDYGQHAKDFTNLEWLKINEGQAEIHIMDLAEKIYDACNESTPKLLKPGEWHIPFEDKMTAPFFYSQVGPNDITVTFIPQEEVEGAWVPKWLQEQKVKVSTAMAARTSYTTVGEEKELSLSDFVEGFEYEIKEGFSDGTVKNQEDFDKAKWVSQIYSDFNFPYIERIFNGKNKQNGLFGLRHKQKGIDYEAMIGLHDRLLTQDPPHSSPLEHCARCMSDEEYERFVKGYVSRIGTIAGTMIAVKKSNEGWCNNFKGFIPYRYFIDNNIKD